MQVQKEAGYATALLMLGPWVAICAANPTHLCPCVFVRRQQC
jgi:hypothetical protein